MTLAITAIAVTSFLILSSWDFKQPFTRISDHGQATDTIPKKSGADTKEKKIRDLDDVLDELNNADLKMDMEKMKKEIEESMKKIDKDKIQMEVDKAMKEVDLQKIQKDVEASIANIDWKKMQAEMEQAMKKIDFEKMQKDVETAMAKIDMEKIQAEINREMKNLDVDMKKMEAELKKIGPEIEKSMEKAKVDIEKAKVEMKEYNDFVDGLEKDGLLNRKDGYTINHKNGELIINDKKVSAEVYNKYRSFLEKHKKFTIDKSDDDFNIDIDR
jgi:hypothetical protein